MIARALDTGDFCSRFNNIPYFFRFVKCYKIINEKIFTFFQKPIDFFLEMWYNTSTCYSNGIFMPFASCLLLVR